MINWDAIANHFADHQRQLREKKLPKKAAPATPDQTRRKVTRILRDLPGTVRAYLERCRLEGHEEGHWLCIAVYSVKNDTAAPHSFEIVQDLLRQEYVQTKLVRTRNAHETSVELYACIPDLKTRAISVINRPRDEF